MSMRCPICGGRLMTFLQFALCQDPRRTLAPTCPECGAVLGPGKRSWQLLALLLAGGALIGLWVVIADETGAATLFDLLLPAGLAVLGLWIAVMVLYWRYGDHVLRRPGPHPLLKPPVTVAIVLVAVVAFCCVAGFVAGLLLASTERTDRPAPRPPKPAVHVTEPVYDPDEAVVFVHKRLPEALRGTLSRSDVALILGLEFEYLRGQGLVAEPGDFVEEPKGPVELDTPAMIEFIRSEAHRSDREYTAEAIEAVLDGEIRYMLHIGIAVTTLDEQADTQDEAPKPERPPSSQD